ncbi:MAG: LolA family protein [Planctomycetota bacterium]
MRSAENIKKLVKNLDLDVDTNTETDQVILKELLKAQEESKKPQPAFASPNIRRHIMKSPLAKFAVAALVAVACLIGLSLWRQTASGIALADVLEQIEQVTACRYRMDATLKVQDMDEKPISQATILTSDAFGAKMNIEVNNPLTGLNMVQEIYVLLPQNTITTLVPNRKIYSELEFDEASLDSWRQQSDPRTVIKRILEFENTSLGRSTIDGIEVEGFRTTDPDGPMGEAEVKIWVDVETKFPVRMEVRKNAGNDTSMCATFHDFEWDVPVDATEFEPVIPDDYTPGQPMMQLMPGKKPAADEEAAKDREVEEKELAMKAQMRAKMLVMSEKAVIDEQAAIKGLKLFAKLGSHYPETIDMPILVGGELARLVKGDSPSTKVFRETIQNMTDEEVMNYKVEVVMSVQGLGRFYQTLVQDNKEPAYYGQSVTPEDADQILMRWKVSDSQYRVIFSNLHAETVTADVLAELEKLLPE